MGTLLDDAVRTYADGAPAGAWWVPARLGGAAPAHDEVEQVVQQRWRRDDGIAG